MSIANFEELCNRFCDTDGFPRPSMQYDDKGRLAFSVCIKGVSVTVLESREIDGEAVSLIAEFGALPQGYEVGGWQALMDANLLMMSADSPWFSRNQVTSKILLQWDCQLTGMRPQEVLRRVTQMSDMALAWRDERATPADDSSSTRCTFPARLTRTPRAWMPRGGHGQHLIAG